MAFFKKSEANMGPRKEEKLLQLKSNNMPSNFLIFKGTNGQFYFHLKAANGEKILHSEGYTAKASCEKGVTSVKQNATNDARFEKRTSANGNHYFVLKAANGEIVGTSELYTTAYNRDNGIEVVKREASGANMEDNT